jgi:hypothetical protein
LATAQEHINQAINNIRFLQNINHSVNNCIDWQVTVSFYTALHLVNAHISTFNLQYRRHTDVKDVLNPYNLTSVMKLPENEYTAYMSLQSLSRRARYLVNEKDNNLAANTAFLTYEKHLAKALKHLDILMQYFTSKYNYTLPTINVKCTELKISADMKYLQKL